MKLLAALAGIMLAIAAVAGFTFLRSAKDSCVDRTISEARSADGRVGALAYERLCGEERTTRVRLWLVDDPRSPSDVWAVWGAASPRVRFNGERAVEIEAAAGARLLEERAWRGVSIALRSP